MGQVRFKDVEPGFWMRKGHLERAYYSDPRYGWKPRTYAIGSHHLTSDDLDYSQNTESQVLHRIQKVRDICLRIHQST